MTIFNASNLNSGIVAGKVQQRLIALQAALDGVRDLYGWSSGVAASDLEDLGFTDADASALLSACSDANALAEIYATGQPPSTYPQAPTVYVYAASQNQVIGAQ